MMQKHRIPIGISLSEEIVFRIDERRGDTPRSRYIQKALEKKLCRTKGHERMKEKGRDSLDR
jgi:metal-responsive CopG/Arc/MetJ family transcriptional regulator